MNLKKSDYVIISIICLFLGIFLVSQYYAGKEYARLIQPENNELIVLEVAKLTRTNADLRREVQDLTNDLNIYRTSSQTDKDAYEKYRSDSRRLDTINGLIAASGEGIIIKITGSLSTPQVVDLVNALKNIGAEIISINEERIVLNTDLGKFGGLESYELKVLGNSKLFKSAVERKGGIVDQIASKEVKIKVTESGLLTVNPGSPIELLNSRVVSDL